MSRAYYSLFLAVRTAIRKQQGASISGVGDNIKHGGLPIALYSANDTKLDAIAKTLEELYRPRISADYELFPNSADVERPGRAKQWAKRAEAAIRDLGSADLSLVAKHWLVKPPK